MKTNKKDIYGRTYTRFGYCLHIVLTVLGVISAVMLFLYTSACENGNMTVLDYLKCTSLWFTVLTASILIHNKVFYREEI